MNFHIPMKKEHPQSGDKVNVNPYIPTKNLRNIVDSAITRLTAYFTIQSDVGSGDLQA